MAARRAAELARSLQARIALIEPHLESVVHHEHLRFQEQAMRQVAQALRSRMILSQADIPNWSASMRQLQRTEKWAALVAQVQAEQRSLSTLAAQGIDTIIGQAEFRRRPTAGVVVNGRVLRSRTYLLACGARLHYPAINGLDSIPYRTMETLLPFSSDHCPRHLVIIGDRPVAFTLAQLFARLGSRVTLVTRRPSLLPKWDIDVVKVLQIQLEADGIQLMTGHEVSQVKQIDQQIWLQVGNQAIATDELILTGDYQVELSSLNLAAASVSSGSSGIMINSHLQTTNPRVYACGMEPVADGHPDVTDHELNVAVRNALFWPTRQLHRSFIPQAIATDPELASVGLTEAAARTRYGSNLVVLRQPLRSLPYAQLQNHTVGFCKLILRPNGRLVGAHMVGSQAGDLMSLWAIALRQKMALTAIARLPHLTTHAAALVNALALQWTQHNLSRGLWRDVLERLFTLRRDWSR